VREPFTALNRINQRNDAIRANSETAVNVTPLLG